MIYAEKGRLKLSVWWFILGYIFLPKMKLEMYEGFNTEFKIKCIWFQNWVVTLALGPSNMVNTSISCLMV